MNTHFLNALLFAQDSQDRLPELPGNYVGLVWLIIIGVVAVIAILTTAWVNVTKSFHITALKEKMVERGMSAAEIERVLAAGTKKGCSPPASIDEPQLPPEKPQPSPMRWPAHSHS
jgi:hypothetical protein